jgi:hypothetical protein
MEFLTLFSSWPGLARLRGPKPKVTLARKLASAGEGPAIHVLKGVAARHKAVLGPAEPDPVAGHDADVMAR